jgi:hypothetical protein
MISRNTASRPRFGNPLAEGGHAVQHCPLPGRRVGGEALLVLDLAYPTREPGPPVQRRTISSSTASIPSRSVDISASVLAEASPGRRGGASGRGWRSCLWRRMGSWRVRPPVRVSSGSGFWRSVAARQERGRPPRKSPQCREPHGS